MLRPWAAGGKALVGMVLLGYLHAGWNWVIHHVECNTLFYKNSSIKLPKRQKNKCKYACGLMTETDTHTHARNDSYEHPPPTLTNDL